MSNIENPENFREIEREIVSALIFSLDGKILMGQKDPAKGGVYPDAWHIPGGGLEEGEKDKIEGLRREIREEVGLEFDHAELIDDTGRGATIKTLKTGEKVFCRMNFNVFKIQLDQDSSEIILSPQEEEFIETKWVDLSELDQVELTPPSIELFTKLGYLN